MRSALALSLVLMLAVSVSAEVKAGKKKEGGAMNPQLAKMTEAISALELTDEQTSQLATAVEAYKASMKSLREEGLTPQITKKKGDAMKLARQEGLKGKELQAKIADTLTADELELVTGAEDAMSTLKKAVAGMLTEQQIAALPEPMQKQLTIKGGKKPKKDA